MAKTFQQLRIGTLLMDLLTRDEERVDAVSGHLRFDICMLIRFILPLFLDLVSNSLLFCVIFYLIHRWLNCCWAALLTTRLVSAIDFITQTPETSQLKIGVFGASTGGAGTYVSTMQYCFIFNNAFTESCSPCPTPPSHNHLRHFPRWPCRLGPVRHFANNHMSGHVYCWRS